ncbi:hypothetical protein NM208_g592 [Fusarium decemcellulare]|uniref:Uncharacterized protein n=1 Tax=Fusarium decemcellulare TaxID=57161 RepID=A0ACC1SZ72_9HYPO|nr:hypothetical protein NM208_g592 [Fusarium decemcellulare]
MNGPINGFAAQGELTPLPAVWDMIAAAEPDRAVVSIAKGHEIEKGYRDITARMMANAVNRAAWFLETQLGKSDSFQTLCYLGPSDLRYPILLAAASKAGYKTFWTSPRNSLEAHLRLMEATECSIFLTPAAVPPGVDEIVGRLHMRHLVVPEQKDWLDATDDVQSYKFNKSSDDVRLDPLTVIHTSGSTGELAFHTYDGRAHMSGFPKPIFIPQGFACVAEALCKAKPENGVNSLWQVFRDTPGRLFTPFPMYHGAGIMFFHHFSQFFGRIPVLPPPTKPVTAELVAKIISSGMVTSAFLPPTLIDGIAQMPTFTENLGHLESLMHAGAHLSAEMCDLLRSKTRLFNLYGQTETGVLHQLYVDEQDSAYVHFGSLSNIEFRHHSDDLYEAVVVRKEGLESYQGGFMVEPDLREVHMHDLFSRHPDPEKSGLWLHRGRADDVIVFETGEKINPASMERSIGTHPKVRSAMVVGEGRFQSALLVEPEKNIYDPAERKALIEMVWPMIEAASNDSPAHGRVVKELVYVTEPQKPFLRTAKGSVNRRATLDLYKEVIDKLYADADQSLMHGGVDGQVLDMNAPMDQITAQLRNLVHQTTAIDVPGEDDDFYLLGMDSLQTLEVSRNLKSVLRSSKVPLERISPSIIYSNPTLRQLSASLFDLATQTPNGIDSNSGTAKVEAIISKLSADLPGRSSRCAPSKVVILTGSTGSFGSYLLSSLLAQQSVKHVYCLNRSAHAMSRQTGVNTARGLISSFDSSAVTFLQCDFLDPLLGLKQNMYDRLLADATHIIHNAWTVNFNLSVDTHLSANIPGVQAMIRLAAATAGSAKLFFISSIGTVMNWRNSGRHGPVPEAMITDSAVAQEIGYAQSKHIAERLLDMAHTKSGIEVCCFRVGQIAGPVGTVKGAWNQSEWFPALVSSCKMLGLVPKSLGALSRIDWIPINVLAETVVELVDYADAKGSQVYNLVNPSVRNWRDIYPVIQRLLHKMEGEEVEVVDYADWVQALRKSAAHTRTNENVEGNPAVKLLEFFASMQRLNNEEDEPIISTEKAERHSPTLRACGPVSEEWMELWMKQWELSVKNKQET